MDRWAIFESELDSCNVCSSSRSSFPTGSKLTEFIAIGSRPGNHEDEARRVFCGPAGNLLDMFLEYAGLTRVSLYCTNLIKCSMFADKTFSYGDYTTCSEKFFKRELEYIQPKVVLIMGNVANYLVPGMQNKKIKEEHGKVFFGKMNPSFLDNWQGYMYVTHNPAHVISRLDQLFDDYVSDAIHFGMLCRLVSGGVLPSGLKEDWQNSGKLAIEIGSLLSSSV